MDSEPKNEQELIHQVGHWAAKNFGPNRAPHLGIVEEVGEATHCVLKRFQKIRGFDDEGRFRDHFSDALADAIIYLADWCSLHNTFFMFGRNMHEPYPLTPDDQNRILTHILQACSRLTQLADREPRDTLRAVDDSDYNMVAQSLCTGLEMWALAYKIELRLMTSLTWMKVRQRDWTKGQTEQPANLS